MKSSDHYLKETIKRVIKLMENKLGGKIMKELAALGTKTYGYLSDNIDTDQKVKGRKKSVIKRKFKFQDYKTF